MPDLLDAATSPVGYGAQSGAGSCRAASRTLAPFVLVLGVLLACAFGLDRAGWSDAGARALVQAVERLRDAEGPTLSLFGLLHPHLPIALVWSLQALPGVDIVTAQIACASLVGAWMLARWHGALARTAPRPFAWAALVLVLANPWVGWSLTASLPSALALAAFHGLCLAVVELVDDDAPQALMRVAGWLLLMLFVDVRAVWVAAALAPMFALVRPNVRDGRDAARAAEPAPLPTVLLVVYLPLVFAFGSWCYLNWLFAGDPLHWIAPEAVREASRVRAAVEGVVSTTAAGWLVGTFAAAMPLVAAFPVAGLLVLRARQGARRAGWAMGAVPLIAALLASVLGQFPDPAEVLALATGTILAGLCRVPPRERAGPRARSSRVVELGLLALGAVMAWALALHGPAVLGGEGLRGWAQAMAAHRPAEPVVSAAPTPDVTTQADRASVAVPARADEPKDVAAGDSDARETLEQALAGWAEAWGAQRVDAYLAFYDPAFETPDGISRARWEALRRERLGRQERIRLHLDAIEVTVDGTHGRTRFVQTWSVPGKTRVDRKSLRWIRRNGQWHVVHESATPVVSAPRSPASSSGTTAPSPPPIE